MTNKKRSPIIKKDGKYYNTLTKRYVSKAYADRINAYFKRKPKTSLHRAGGHGFYKREKPIPEHSRQVKQLLYKRGSQIIKTRDLKGKTVFYSPVYNEVLEEIDVKRFTTFDYRICNKKINVELFRLTRDRNNIYHMFTWFVNRQFYDPLSLDAWLFNTGLKTYECIEREMKKVAKHLRFSKYMSIYGQVKVYVYTDIDGRETGHTFGRTLANTEGFLLMKDDFIKTIKFYIDLLETRSYSNLAILKISLYCYDFEKFASPKSRFFSKYRIGIERV